MTTATSKQNAKLKCSKLQCDYCKCSMYSDSVCGCESNVVISSIHNLLSVTQNDAQTDYLNEMSESISENRAALVIGAGVSIPANMPNWVGLVSRMMGYSMQYKLVNSLFTEKAEDNANNNRKSNLARALIIGELKFLKGVNTLESAEYVSQSFDDETLPRAVRDRLPEASMKTMIHSMVNESNGPKELLADYFAKHPDSSILDCIPVLVRERIKRQDISEEELYSEIKRYIASIDGFGKRIAGINTTFAVSYLLSQSKGFQKAMTYNYDPLVQEQMIELFGMEAKNIITHPGKWNTFGVKGPLTKEIFHVHGFVPGERHRGMLSDNEKNKQVFPDASNRLILSEDSYHEIEQKGIYNWSSTIQSHFLNKYNCIFVGFSAEDYNFKRILKQLDSLPEMIPDNRPWHYLILTIDDFVVQTFEDVCRYYHMKYENKLSEDLFTEIAVDCEILIQEVLACKEKYWERYHIRPIWVGVEDIPKILTGLLNNK